MSEAPVPGPPGSAAQPRFWRSLLADARVAAANRGHPLPGAGRPRLLLEAARLAYRTDAFAGQACYRLGARLGGVGVPLLPGALSRLARRLARIEIGPEPLLRPGVYIAHGEVTIEGRSEIHPQTVLSPFVEIGPAPGGRAGPRIGPGARIGTGARIRGELRVGDSARVGANAFVTEDVPAGATAVGDPARIVPAGPP